MESLEVMDESVSLASKREEADMQYMLDAFSCGVGNVDEFHQRLQSELATLEVCAFMTGDQ